ncbi:MAG: acyl-CoA thioesterase [Candidatus Brocadiae bacterium]|nr:acyl-CoA thioesterase [Candidatus Brocadiia bacterium]
MPASLAPGGVYRKTLPIRFADVDYARILYFPRQFHLIHTVMEDFFREVLDLPYAVVLKDDRVGFPTVHLDADFLKPLDFGDNVDIDMRVRELGRSRVVFQYDLSKGRVPTGRCVQTTVAVSMDTWSSVELPPKYRERLEQVRALSGEKS